MTEWEHVLKAVVHRAYDARAVGDTAAFSAACQEIVDAHGRWPIVEVLPRLHEADEILAGVRGPRQAALELLRSTNHLVRSAEPQETGIAA